ncbi:MAG: transposase [Methylotetracoccus sp.]
MQQALQTVLEGEMTDWLGAAPGERNEQRTGYRAGYYSRQLVAHQRAGTGSVPRRTMWRFFDGAVRTLPAVALVAAWRKCTCRGVDAEGQGDHRGALWPPGFRRVRSARSTRAWTQPWSALPPVHWRRSIPI